MIVKKSNCNTEQQHMYLKDAQSPVVFDAKKKTTRVE